MTEQVRLKELTGLFHNLLACSADDAVAQGLATYRDRFEEAHALYKASAGLEDAQTGAREDAAGDVHCLAYDALEAAAGMQPTTLQGVAALAEAILIEEGEDMNATVHAALQSIRDAVIGMCLTSLRECLAASKPSAHLHSQVIVLAS